MLLDNIDELTLEMEAWKAHFDMWNLPECSQALEKSLHNMHHTFGTPGSYDRKEYDKANKKKHCDD